MRIAFYRIDECKDKREKEEIKMVQINQEKCIGCGLCVKDCIAAAIKIKDQKAEIVNDCIYCGHCVAVCPSEAVSIPSYDMEEVEAYDKDSFHIDPENYLHAIKFRRSIRNFKPDKIEPEKAKMFLNAGRYTPTAKNQQDCTFVFVQDKLEEFKELFWSEVPGIVEEWKKVNPMAARMFRLFYKRQQRNAKDDLLFFQTPAFLVIAADHPLDGGLAAANIENMAVAQGLGALFSGYTQHIIEKSDVLKNWLGITKKQITCCMLIGYPAVKYQRTAPRKKADIIWK